MLEVAGALRVPVAEQPQLRVQPGDLRCRRSARGCCRHENHAGVLPELDHVVGKPRRDHVAEGGLGGHNARAEIPNRTTPSLSNVLACRASRCDVAQSSRWRIEVLRAERRRLHGGDGGAMVDQVGSLQMMRARGHTQRRGMQFGERRALGLGLVGVHLCVAWLGDVAAMQKWLPGSRVQPWRDV